MYTPYFILRRDFFTPESTVGIATAHPHTRAIAQAMFFTSPAFLLAFR